jgi:uncharacterized protein YaeQ
LSAIPRLHKAAKAAPRVAVYSHRPVAALVKRLAVERVHRGNEIELYEVDRELLAALTTRLTRRMRLNLAITDRHLYLSLGEETLSGSVIRHRLGAVA